MRKSILFCSIALAISFSSLAQVDDWPVLKDYDASHINKIALPVGGIGTGTVSLGGRGNLQDWEIMNRPAKGYNPGPGNNRAPFFVIYTGQKGNEKTKLLEGPAPLYEYEGSSGDVKTPNHGLPRFAKAGFSAAYPFGRVSLSDPDMPVKVRIMTYNPLIPGDADKSGIPIAILKFEIENITDQSFPVSICGSMQNFIGEDGASGLSISNKNLFKDENGLKGIYMYSEGVDSTLEQWGTMALTTISGDQSISYRTNWKPQRWGSSVLDYWDDFTADGILEEREETGESKPMASLASQMILEPGETREIRFYITWHFPNRKSWATSMMKNYYTTQYKDAWDVITKTEPLLPALEKETKEFVNAFIQSDLPEVVKEAALFNVSTLRTQTCFRLDDGNFYAWEGCNDNSGCCFGSCTHVWNYEQATGFLFGDLAKKRREIEFGLATDDNGLMSFRVSLPKDNIRNFGRAAADGQMGAIMKMYRDWQLSGDDEMLKQLYPQVKKAIEFCWLPGGWDADMDGVMEGVQHNTMDVEYYGPNPQMGIWYLGALRSVAEMAKYMGDKEFATNCLAMYGNGRKWIDENLFNGEYYIHKIQLPQSVDDINPGLIIGMGAKDSFNPEYQLGEGCLVDQLVGQYVAHITGLGYLVEPDNVKTTLNSIMKYNYKENLRDHFNSFRTFALGDEAALLMASYPYSRPEDPFPYFTEVMTGFEYTAAVGMLYEDQMENGLKCISSIRDRYDGNKRSPFDEAECGHHYGRAMASWSAVMALTGFHYSAVTGEMSINSVPGNYFWSNGYAYGTVNITDETTNKLVVINVLGGSLKIENLILNGYGKVKVKTGKLNKMDKLEIRVKNNSPKAGMPLNLIVSKNIPVIKPVLFLNEENKKIRKAAFTDMIKVSLTCETKGTVIRYTTDGTDPGKRSAVYKSPLTISKDKQIKALAFLKGRKGMVITKLDLFKFNKFKNIVLETKASPKYAPEGVSILNDGIHGSSNFADGSWLGFEGDDVKLTIDLGSLQEVKQIKTGFLNNNASWVFLPENVKFAISEDGKSYTDVADIHITEFQKAERGSTFYSLYNFEKKSFRYIKVNAKNIGVCPPGHPGVGKKAWIFVDEVEIK